LVRSSLTSYFGAGHNVRAIVRSADKAKTVATLGAELVFGELADAEL
jgi:uncharacterized protein YbjT (DUF2867 family)